MSPVTIIDLIPIILLVCIAREAACVYEYVCKLIYVSIYKNIYARTFCSKVFALPGEGLLLYFLFEVSYLVLKCLVVLVHAKRITLGVLLVLRRVIMTAA